MPTTAPGARKPPSVGGRIALGLFFLVFTGAGAAGFIFLFIKPVLQAQAARSWVATPCRIVSAEIKEHSDSDGSTYSPEIRYEYAFDGRTYRGDRRAFVGMSSSHGWAQGVLRQYPVGSQTTCWVDPDEPSEAVLERDLGWSILLGLIPLVFLVVGLGGGYYAVFGKMERADNAPYKQLTARQQDPGQGGGILLDPSGARRKKVIGLFIFALIWNGFVGAMFYAAWGEGIAPMIFLGLFQLIGLLIFGMAIYTLLQIFNPVPVLRLSDDRLSLGETLTIDYVLRGNTGRLRKLTVTLQGREEAQYRRGTDTVTEKHVFASLSLLSTEDPNEMNGGTLAITIPWDTMHSFESAHNKIIWQLKVDGDIPGWPDIEDEHPLTICPPAPQDGVPEA